MMVSKSKCIGGLMAASGSAKGAATHLNAVLPHRPMHEFLPGVEGEAVGDVAGGQVERHLDPI